MSKRYWMFAGALILFQLSSLAYAQSEPDRVVEQYIAALSQGRFAEARTLTLESANMDGSIFGSWLFGTGGAGLPTATAELFLSQKFVQAFRYTITGTTPVGENQVYVTAIRSSPDVAHLYEWAVLPKQGAEPYEIITAIDTYLTTVNFPMVDQRDCGRQVHPPGATARRPGGARTGWSSRRCRFAVGDRCAGTAASGTHHHDNLDGRRSAPVRCPIPRHLAGIQRYLPLPFPDQRRGRPVGAQKAAVLETPGAASEA